MSKPKFQFRKPNKAGDSKPAGDMKKGSPIEILPYAFGDKNMFKECMGNQAGTRSRHRIWKSGKLNQNR